MKRRTSAIASAALAAWLYTSLTALAVEKSSAEPVATVGGDTITDRDIVDYAFQYPQLMSELRTPGGPMRILEYMIGDRLMLLEGRRQGIPEPNSKDLRQYLTEIEQRLLKPCPPPTEAQAKTYYDNNPKLFSSPLRLRLQRIGLDTSAAQIEAHTSKLLAVKRQIESGESEFAAIADQISEDLIGNGRGGDIGYVSIDVDANPAYQIFLQAGPETIIGPIEEPGKLYLYRVTGRQDPILDDFSSVKRDAALGYARDCKQRTVADLLAQLRERWPVEILVEQISITPERR